MAWSATARFDGDLVTPSAARAFVRHAVGGLYRDAAVAAAAADDAVVIVSELVTNAVQAASPVVEVGVSVSVHGATADLLLTVTDRVGGTPTLGGPAAEDQPHGRGLAIVAVLSQDWGIEGLRGRGPGKAVWARLPLAVVPDRLGPRPA